jgi:GNAT superfamily N-acetyltransferase
LAAAGILHAVGDREEIALTCQPVSARGRKELSMRNQKESDGGAQGKGLAKRLLAHLARWLPRLGKIHLDLEYQKAHDFKNLFHPKNGVDYEWVTGYLYCPIRIDRL